MSGQDEFYMVAHVGDSTYYGLFRTVAEANAYVDAVVARGDEDHDELWVLRAPVTPPGAKPVQLSWFNQSLIVGCEPGAK